MALKLKSRTEVFVPTYDGNDQLPLEEQIKVTYRRMTVGDYFKLQRDTGTNLMVGLSVDVADIGSMDQHWKLMETALVNQDAQFAGIDLDGTAVTAARDVVAGLQITHLPLLAEVFNAILSGASPTEGEVKNLPPDSEPENSESGPSVEPVTPV